MPCRITPEQQRLWRQERQEEERHKETRSQRERRSRENERIAQLENQWAQFGQQVRRAQRQQQQRALAVRNLQLIDEIQQSMNPPPVQSRPEPEIVYVPEDEWGTGRLGHADFNPKLLAQPTRW